MRNKTTFVTSPAKTMRRLIGAGIGSGLGGVVVDHMGIDVTFWAGAAVVLLSAVLLVAYNPREQKTTDGFVPNT